MISNKPDIKGKSTRNITKSLLFIFPCLVFFTQARAFESSLSGYVRDSVLTTQADSLLVKRGVFSAGITYGNNSSFFGRSQTIKYPYLSADVTVKGKKGIWISALGYQIFDINGVVDETNLAIGWDVDLSKRIDASLSYSRFFFGPSNPLLKSGVSNAVTAYTGFDLSYVYTRISTSYIFGSVHDFFLILDNSRYFEKKKVFHKSGYLSFEPRISIIAGTQSFAQSHIDREQTTTLSPVSSPIGGGRPGAGRPTSSGSTSGGTTTVTTQFNLLTYELKIPVTYSIGKFSLEGTWRYILPVNLLEGDNSTPQSFWTASLYYTFFLSSSKKCPKAP